MLSNLVNAIILKDNDNIYIKTITGPTISFSYGSLEIVSRIHRQFI